MLWARGVRGCLVLRVFLSMWGWRTCCGTRDRPAVGWHVRPDGWVLGPLDAHVNPMGGAWAGVPMLHVSGPAAHERVSATTCRAQVTETL